MAPFSLISKSHNHARSNSFPSTPHPITVECNKSLARFRACDASSSCSLLSCKLPDLQDLHDCIEKLVHLPLTQEVLFKERQEKWVDELLDGFLGFLDVCTAAMDALLHTKECTRELQWILRRRRVGEVEMTTEVKEFLTSRKVVRKAILKALGNMRSIASKCNVSLTNKDHQTVALFGLLKEVEVVTLSTFASLLKFISGSTQAKQSSWSLVSKLRHSQRVACTQEVDESEFARVDAALQSFIFAMTSKSDSIDKLQSQLEKMEPCIQDLEEGLECLFRRLIKIRFTLLNILNH